MERRTYELDEVDLAVNWEICECPFCGGQGTIPYDHDWDETYECDECGGTGEIAIEYEEPWEK
jgi:RecJ-like exonuclease